MNLRPSHPVGRALGQLAEQVAAVPAEGVGLPDIQIAGVTLRSQDAQVADLFAALPGASSHGATYVGEAVARGAAAILTDAAGAAAIGRDVDVPVVIHPDPRSVLGELAATVYGRPSEKLRVIGVTGTSGKTTTTYLAEAGLKSADRVAGLIGTVGIRIDGRDQPSALTTPEAPDLQALLALMVEAGVDTVVMEVSSHALTLGRVDGVHFAVGGFTNLSRDHLDFHPTMQDYFDAKARLFDPEFDTHATASVICIDDDAGREMARLAADPVTVSATGRDADWGIEDVRAVGAGSQAGAQEFLAVDPAGVHHGLRIALPGRYNVANCLLATALLDAVGVSPEQAAPGLRAAHVPGRLEAIDRGQEFLALVDYAHKPGALQAVLQTLRAQVTGRIAVVFGAGGNRDPGKREPDGPGRSGTGRSGRGDRRQSPRRGPRGHQVGDHRGRGAGEPRRDRRDRRPPRSHRLRGRVGTTRRRGARCREGPRGRADQPRPDPALRRSRRAGQGARGVGVARVIDLSIAQIADIVGGELADITPAAAAATRVTGTIEFDSRAVTPGGMFLALPGARSDGHDFAAAAVAGGAAVVLAARPVGVPAIIVRPGAGSPGDAAASVLEHDTDGSGAAVLAALARLATAVAAELVDGGLTIVGVTGSSGKTSTKDLLAAVLAPLGEVVAPPGSFNNELGHPWTVLRATESTDYLILEMSARRRGNIAALAAVAPPAIGVVLNVGTAHLGEFGSREAIAATKAELPQAISASGSVILNVDDAAVAAMADQTAARVIRVSRERGGPEVDVWAGDVTLDELARPRFTMHAAGGEVDSR